MCSARLKAGSTKALKNRVATLTLKLSFYWRFDVSAEVEDPGSTGGRDPQSLFIEIACSERRGPAELRQALVLAFAP